MFAPLTLVSVAVAFSAVVHSIPIPDNDPFYFPPAGFEFTAPGTVFRSRPSKSTIWFVNATQILYRTTNAQGGAIATVATILKGPKSTSSKLVAYQAYEDAANTTCSPSYAQNTGGAGPFQPEFGPEVPNGLDNGWTLVVSDYEGINSTFAAGRVEGMATLDALRAVLNFAPAGIDRNAALGLYGYSGGAIATGWAAGLSTTYAPELNIKGFAFGGIPSNVSSTLLKVDGTLFAGFGAGGTAGLISAYPELQRRYNEIATPDGQAAITKVRQQCATDDLFGFAFQKLLTTKYQTLGPDLLTDPTVAKVLKQQVMGEVSRETPKAPVLMYHSTSDEVIPYESANKTVHNWCANGANIDFRTDVAGAGHLGLELAYTKTATDWLAARLNGESVASGCKYSNIISLGFPLSVPSGGGNQRTTNTNAEQLLGKGDAKVLAKMKAQWAKGEKMDFYKYLADPAAASQ